MLDIKAGDVINDDEILVEMFNNYYVNIIENSTGITPIELGTLLDPKLDRDTVEKIVKHYENHQSITENKKLARVNQSFRFPKAKTKNIVKIINSLNSKKATGPDGIPMKVIKTASKIMDSHLTNVINQDLELNSFSELPL